MDFQKEIEKTILDGLRKAVKQEAPKFVKASSGRDNPLVDSSTKKFGFSKLLDSNIRP